MESLFSTMEVSLILKKKTKTDPKVAESPPGHGRCLIQKGPQNGQLATNLLVSKMGKRKLKTSVPAVVKMVPKRSKNHQIHAQDLQEQMQDVLSWANYYWTIITRLKGFGGGLRGGPR